MRRLTWDETWMEIARVMSRRSACQNTRVGAVIVSDEQRILSTGYNGQPAHYRHGPCEVACPRAKQDGQDQFTDCIAIHAEANALLFVDRSQCLQGTIYTTRVPCWECAKLISNSGLNTVIALLDPTRDAKLEPERSVKFMRDSGLSVVTWEDDNGSA